jgi:hypothetical protein
MTMSNKLLIEVLDRLGDLEAVVLERRPAARSGADRRDSRLTKTAVAARKGVSPRTIDRWRKAGLMPPPDDVINGRQYWWLSTLQRHERARARVPAPPINNPQKAALRTDEPRSRKRAEAEEAA